MKKFEIFGNVAFYDCVANNDILTSVSQSAKWSDEARKKGLETLYISSKGDTAFKVCYGSAIVPIKKEMYNSEFAKCVAENEAKQAETACAIVDSDAAQMAVNSVTTEQTERSKPKIMMNNADFHEKVKAIVIEVLRQATATLTQ